MASARRILIIGSGFGGLGLADPAEARRDRQLHDPREGATTLGGTWRDNTYPGAACDVPSMLYSFSLRAEDRLDPQVVGPGRDPRLHGGLRRRNDLLRHVRFGVEVASARFDEARGTWTVRTTDRRGARRRRARQQRRPAAPAADPEAPGLETLPRPELPLGALEPRRRPRRQARRRRSATPRAPIQFIPEIAKEVAHLTIFQRSANWMIARGDRPFHPWETLDPDARPRRAPVLPRVPLGLRGAAPLPRHAPEARARAASTPSGRSRTSRRTSSDPELRARLTPDYPIGGKRILIHDDFFRRSAARTSSS